MRMPFKRRDVLSIAVTFFLIGGFAGDRALAGGDVLMDTVKRVEDRLDARVGIAIYDEQTGKNWQYHADDRFPMTSTFKALACAGVLARVDAGEEDLDRVIMVRQSDLVTYSPVTEKRVGDPGMKLSEMCEAALSVSDNTAANAVLDSLDGPQGFTRFMRSIGDEVTRLDRRETGLNEAVPGDPRDTTTPNAIAAGLRKLVLGDVLTPASRQRLTDWLIGNKVGDALLRAGVPKDWRVADKTGGGGHGSRSIVAVMWPPHRKPVIAAIYITETDASFDARNAAIAEIGGALKAALAD